MSRLAAILACLSLAGCSAAPSAESSAVADLDTPFTLAPGAAATVSSTPLKVRFVSVTEDSRCPSDATCVWAGEVKVRFDIEGAKSRSQIELREGDSGAAGQHRLTLMKVEPPAVSGVQITPQDYRVTLKVSNE